MTNDLRFALRMIRAHGWFSAAIIVTLALAIGVNTTVFTLVNAVLFKPVPLPGGARLVVVSNQNLNESVSRMGVSYPDFVDMRRQNTSLQALEATDGGEAVLSDAGNPPQRFRMAIVSSGMFGVVQTPPLLGRSFIKADDRPGGESVVVIGYNIWQTRYGGVKEIAGKVVRLNGKPTTIIGVMPAGFRFPSGEDLWTPLVPTAELEKRSMRRLSLYGLLKPGIAIESAGSDLAIIAKRLSSAYPASNKDIGVNIQTFHQAFNGGNIRTVFLLMLGAVACVLLIACANVANMMLSRALARRRENSVRAALGASRWQLVRQLLVESILYSTAGGLSGLLLAKVAVHYFDLATLEQRPYWIGFGMDFVAFGYFAALSIGSGLLFGVLPALRASKVDLTTELKEGARGSVGGRAGRPAGVLVVLQFALTVVLLAGAGLMMRSFFKAQSLNDFVPAAQMFTARINLPDDAGQAYADKDKRVRFYEDLERRLEVLPGVAGVAVSSNLPGGGAPRGDIEIEGRGAEKASRALHAAYVVVSPTYVSLIGLPMRAGRSFHQRDGDPGREAAIATREFAAHYWPGQSPLGKRFRFLTKDTPGPWIQIVGVTADVVQMLQDDEPPPLVFIPHRQQGWGGMGIVVRTNGIPPAEMARSLGVAVQAMDQDLPLFDAQTMVEALYKQRWFLSVFGALFFSFAAIGLVIALVGIYGVSAQAATLRTREIGIRLALGATSQNILLVMLSRGATQLVLGLLIGLAGAFAVTNLLKAALVQVSPHDPLVLAGVAGLLVATGLFACWLPARRAAALHPVDALREE
jgi:predicted permease